MRLGLLTLASPDADVDTVLSAERRVAAFFRERDVDVITASGGASAEANPEDTKADRVSVIASAKDAAGEAARLRRADCDGVAFFVRDGADVSVVAEAALHLTGPLLLCGGEPAAATAAAAAALFFSAAGVLEEVGVAFDRLMVTDDEALPSRIENWLTRFAAKKARQNGAEAAQTLYGQRLAIYGTHPAFPACDPAQWLSQFGVVVEQYADAPQNPPEPMPDFCVFPQWNAEKPMPGYDLPTVCPRNTDANAALTLHLLRLVAGGGETPPPVVLATIAGTDSGGIRLRGAGDDPAADAGSAVTIARITRHRGRFHCLLAVGEIAAPSDVDSGSVRVALAPAGASIEHLAASGDVGVISGDWAGALRAACESLDISVKLLQ